MASVVEKAVAAVLRTIKFNDLAKRPGLADFVRAHGGLGRAAPVAALAAQRRRSAGGAGDWRAAGVGAQQRRQGFCGWEFAGREASAEIIKDWYKKGRENSSEIAQATDIAGDDIKNRAALR